MDDSKLGFTANEAGISNNYPPITILVVLVLLVLLCLLLGSGLLALLGLWYDLGWEEALEQLRQGADASLRQYVRSGIALTHLMSFVVPAMGLAIFLYRKNWYKFLQLQWTNTPRLLSNIVIGGIWLFTALPLVQWLYQINAALPLPEWMRQAEASSSTLISNLLVSQSTTELLLNVLVIAVLPALGEEMIFRGLLQRRLQAWTRNHHTAIWIAAALFSAFHFQFEGFLSRMALGALLGYLLFFSGTLWVPIIVHFLNNGLQIIALHFSERSFSEMDISQMPPPSIPLIVISAIFVAGIGYFLYQFNRPDTDPSNVTE